MSDDVNEETKTATEAPAKKGQKKATPPAPASEPADAPETITMVFPRDVSIIHEGKKITWKEGTRQVPVGFADHYYLRASGVTVYDATS